MKNPFKMLLVLMFMFLMLLFQPAFSKKKVKRTTSLAKLHWIIGTWHSTSDNGELYESWAKTNDTLYSGKSFMVKGIDTSLAETMELKQIGKSLYYIPTVKNQNNNKPVLFKLKYIKFTQYIFQNLKHDFPQRIIYSNPKTEVLYAKIEGDDKGKYRKEEFRMNRVK